ncbi:hypothetical protein HUG15_00355 [Salicibibacter cibarius]|uniref:Uncharacterized protein n=1 Tax=Salicibibacter cibarius TaxID=2743000 RepID=A0A7T6YZJ8_9BACI|nr:hypothetical protein [Salicibibacter cibarius]QQK74220.1 hypothetical protein HUG15_00355 [Salicibibacter cibarius]
MRLKKCITTQQLTGDLSGITATVRVINEETGEVVRHLERTYWNVPPFIVGKRIKDAAYELAQDAGFEHVTEFHEKEAIE